MSRRNLLSMATHWLISHPWLKLIALILAVLVWFYAKSEIQGLNP